MKEILDRLKERRVFSIRNVKEPVRDFVLFEIPASSTELLG
jgi:hypothetical protein